MSISSRPSVPPSPACGLSAATARSGCATAKSRASAAAAIRPAATILSLLSAATASRSGRCTVTGTTRSSAQASIMATAAPPASSARNSVWPGWRNPAAWSVSFWIGLVTSAAARPAPTSVAPVRIAAITAGALAGSGRPAATGRGNAIGRTGSAWGNAGAASSGAAMGRSGTGQPSAAASRSSRAGSSSAKKGGSACARRCRQASRVSSPPIPAGSPMVSASGAVIRGYPRRRRGAGRADSGVPGHRAAPAPAGP